MKKAILIICGVVITACSTNTRLDGSVVEPTYTSKPTFCYQLAPQEQKPAVNCIGSGGHN